MRGLIWRVLGAAVALALMAAPAQAITVIDFTTGNAGQGGLIRLFDDGNLSGTGIPIATAVITGAPVNNGLFAVTGPANGEFLQSVGALSFSTGGLAGTNFIRIDGCIPGGTPTLVPCPGDVTGAQFPILLSGTISTWAFTEAADGLSGARGSDFKNAGLLVNIGLSPDTPFDYFGFSITTQTLTPQNPVGSAISTDIRNTVPEPGSMLLLGCGLIGLAGAVRRRMKK